MDKSHYGYVSALSGLIIGTFLLTGANKGLLKNSLLAITIVLGGVFIFEWISEFDEITKEISTRTFIGRGGPLTNMATGIFFPLLAAALLLFNLFSKGGGNKKKGRVMRKRPRSEGEGL